MAKNNKRVARVRAVEKNSRRRVGALSKSPGFEPMLTETSLALPDGSSTDSRNYSRDVSRERYSSLQRKKRRRRRGIIIAISVLSTLLVGSLAAALIYLTAIGASLNGGLDMNSLKSALTERGLNEPFYMLLMGTDRRKGETVDRSDSILLARIDPAKKQTILLSIPRDTRVELEGYGTQKINGAHSLLGGAKGSIQTVENFTGVKISHYAEIDFEGFKDLVDALGGVEINVPYEIQDTEAGTDKKDGYVRKGLQTLDGEHALIFCRSRKTSPLGDYQRQANQRVFLKALAKKILQADPATMLKSVTAMADAVSTDMDVTEIFGIAQALKGMTEKDIYSYTVPSNPGMIGGVSYVIPEEAEWELLMNTIRSGGIPPKQREDLAGVVPKGYENSTGTSSSKKSSSSSSSDTSSSSESSGG